MITRVLTCLLLLATPGLIHADAVSAGVKSVDGTAPITTPGGTTHDLAKDSTLPPGTVIHTGSDSKVGLHLLPGANVVVGPNSDVSIVALDYSKPASGEASRKVVLNIQDGQVFNSIVHGDGEGTTDYRVRTPQGVAAARGTVFTVSVNGRKVTVDVTADDVTFRDNKGHVTTIHQGHGGTFPGGIIVVLTPREIAGIEHILAEIFGSFGGGSGPVGGGGGGGGNGGGNLNPGNNGNGSGGGQNSPD